MPSPPGQRKPLRRLWSWGVKEFQAFPSLDAAEQIGIGVAVVIGGVVAILTFYAVADYKPDLTAMALLLGADMEAGILIVALLAVVFEFWKLRKPPPERPIDIHIHWDGPRYVTADEELE